MAEKKRHIRQRPDEYYPQPQISESDAWTSMSELLDEKMPQKKKPFFPLFALLLTILSGSLIFGLLLYKNQTTGIATPNTQKEVLPGSQKPALSVPPSDNPQRESVSAETGEGKSASSIANENAGNVIITSLSNSDSDERLLSNIRIAPPENEQNKENGEVELTVEPKKNISQPFQGNKSLPSFSDSFENPMLFNQLPAKSILLLTPSNLKPIQPQFPRDSNIHPERSEKTLDKTFHYGLEWAGNFPFLSIGTYPNDLKTRNGIYLLAIPGVWASRNINRNSELSFHLRPFFDYFNGRTSFYKLNRLDSLGNTETNSMEEARLWKTTGSSIALKYQHQVFNNLWAGTGVSYDHNWQATGSVRKRLPRQGEWGADSLQLFNRSDRYWQYIRPANLVFNFDINYCIRAIHLGGSLQLPVLPPGNRAITNVRPANGQIYLRWRIQ